MQPGGNARCLAAAADDVLPKETMLWLRNLDGNCVQCSGGMIAGRRADYPQATLLFDSEAI